MLEYCIGRVMRLEDFDSVRIQSIVALYRQDDLHLKLTGST